jgi:hypothetical protein
MLLLGVPAIPRPALARPPRKTPPSTSAVPPPPESPEEQLARGRQAYLRSDLDGTVRVVHPLLYPEITLRSDEDVIEAHRLLALAYLFLHRDKDAEDELNSILALKPGFTLDPVTDPLIAIRFLDALKAREEERLRRIERQAAEHARLEEERHRAAEEERLRKTLQPNVIAVRTVEHHHYVLNFVPFGMGQLQNGERRKAIALLATQLALGATSLALWTTLEVRYAGGKTPVPIAEVPQANAIRVTSLVAGGLFWADVLYGIIDAMVHYQAEVVRETVLPPATTPATPPPGAPAAPHASLRLFPVASPAGWSGAGLSIQGVF